MNHEQTNIKTPEFVSLQFQLAGLGSRTAAFLIDTILLSIINVVTFITLLLVLYGGPDSWFFMEVGSLPIAITIILLFILNWSYFFLYEFFSGGKTLGKKWVGIRVIQENGHSITLLSSFIRNFLRIIDSLPASYLLGIVMIFIHTKHKRIGDLVAGTIVVHERRSKKGKKQTPLEKEIEKRGLSKEFLVIDNWALKSLGNKEWKLLQTYSNRLLDLRPDEKWRRTKQISDLLLPIVGIETQGKTEEELENALLVLYLYLKDDWEFEL